MQPPGPNASATTVLAKLAATMFEVPWLFRQMLAGGDAANKSNRKLGARLRSPLPVALLLSTVLPLEGPRIPIPALPFP
jgi:hypothetical protein